MKLLHIAYVDNDPCSGVSVAVPKHILSQQKIEDVAFVNVAGCAVAGVQHQLPYTAGFTVEALESPFCAPDLVVFHEVYRPPFLKIAKELRRRHIPYIIVPHGCLTREAQHKKFLKKKLGNALFFSEFIRHAAAVQCLSAQEHETTAYGREHFLGVNGMEMPPVKKTAFHTDRIDMLYIGRLDPFHKGLDLLIEAVSSVKPRLLERRCVLRLYGPDVDGQREAVESLIRAHGVEDIVVLNGAILGDEKRDALLNADVFVQTSRFEGMPMGVLEALSYGLPCVLTTGTCVGEQVAKAGAGWVCNVSVPSIATALLSACEERETWMSRSAKAVAFIEKEFELSRVAEQTLDLYRRFIR